MFQCSQPSKLEVSPGFIARDGSSKVGASQPWKDPFNLELGSIDALGTTLPTPVFTNPNPSGIELWKQTPNTKLERFKCWTPYMHSLPTRTGPSTLIRPYPSAQKNKKENDTLSWVYNSEKDASYLLSTRLSAPRIRPKSSLNRGGLSPSVPSIAWRR